MARRTVSLVPGLALTIGLGWTSVWLADVIGVRLLGFAKTPVSPVMLAIVLGLVLRAVAPFPKALTPGVEFSVTRVLRLGIILLGIRLSIGDAFNLGAYGVPIVLICVAAALFPTTRLNRLLGLPGRLGALIAVGTSICGVTAIVAMAPAIEAEEDEVAYAVAVITVFGLMATLLYPFVAHFAFGGREVEAGLFLGTSVHDTSQVVGAASVYADLFGAPRALEAATVTKLVRNVFMLAVIPLVALHHARSGGGREMAGKASLAGLFPQFILGFLLLAVVRSIGDSGVADGGQAFGVWDASAWTALHGTVKTGAEYLLLVALAGVGMSTDFRSFGRLGLKPFLVGLGAALAVGLVSFVAISALGSLVTL
ncbi:MAG: putative sulfate exporter family transporter [Actinobacteria bacterium]|nr:putative sulfate exporter family transporter [Actinomycetota bacterium]